jgi:hypothetical protein
MQEKKLKVEILLNFDTARKGKGRFSKEEYTCRYPCLWGDCSLNGILVVPENCQIIQAR